MRPTLVETLTIALKSLEQYGYQRVRLVELSSDVQIVEIRHCSEKVPRCSVPFRYLNFWDPVKMRTPHVFVVARTTSLKRNKLSL